MARRETVTAEIAAPRLAAPRSGRPLTPQGLGRILADLSAGQVTEAATLFDEMNEQDHHLAAVFQTRTDPSSDPVTTLPTSVEHATDRTGPS